MITFFVTVFLSQTYDGRSSPASRDLEIHDHDLSVEGVVEEEHHVVVSYCVVLPMVVHWLVQFYSSEGEDEDAPDNSQEENRTVREVL